MSDHEAALDLLRERFPESEGWVVTLDASAAMANLCSDPYHAFALKRAGDGSRATVHLSAWGDSPKDAAYALFDHLDAATHAAQVRALVEAVERAHSLAGWATDVVAWGPVDAALAAMPASLRGKGGGQVNLHELGDRIAEYRAKALPVIQRACTRLGEDECEAVLNALVHHGYVGAGPSVERAREALAAVLRDRNLTPDGWSDIWALLDSARSERDALRARLAEAEAILESLSNYLDVMPDANALLTDEVRMEHRIARVYLRKIAPKEGA